MIDESAAAAIALLRANAGFATAMMWLPDADMTWHPCGGASDDVFGESGSIDGDLHSSSGMCLQS